MRKILLLIMSLLPVSLFAENISPQKAKAVAEGIFQRGKTTFGADKVDLALVWDGMTPISALPGFPAFSTSLAASSTSSADAPAFYVFNNQSGKGFAIVAGDDRVAPVLGYSFESNVTIENMPVNLYSWLESIREEVNYVRDRDLSAGSDVQRMWSDFEISEPLVLHETALWDQGAPYNWQSPVYFDGTEMVNAVTGCAATAAAIVMKFHEWPPAGKGTAPGYVTNGGQSYPERILGTYDWDLMPMRYFDEYGHALFTQEQGDEIATLMADLGTLFEATYPVSGANETSVYPSKVPSALVEYMDYDPSMELIFLADLPIWRWHEMLMGELDRTPVMYLAQSVIGGHAFVLDGYTEDAFYHVNWGWGGWANGYFMLSTMNPIPNSPIEEGFNRSQYFIRNVKRNTGETNPDSQHAILSYYNYENVYGMELIGQDPSDLANFPGTITVQPGTVYPVNKDFYGDIVLALVSSEGEIKVKLLDYFYEKDNPLPAGFLQPFFDVQCESSRIQYGDRLIALYRNEGEEEFKPVLGDVLHGAVPEIVFNDPQTSIEMNSTLDYDCTTNTVTLNFPQDVQVQFLNEAGFDRIDRCQLSKGKLVVDGTKLIPGIYRVILSRGTERKDLFIKF